jgi:hypothetical protein
MHHIILDSEIDFDGWRQAARTLALNGVNPSDVTWTVRGNEPELFERQNIEEPPEPSQNTFNVPAKFIVLARVTILHRDAERLAVLYRLLWRLRSDLPPNFHPAAIRASVFCTPCGGGGATGDRRSWSGLRSRAPVAVNVAA